MTWSPDTPKTASDPRRITSLQNETVKLLRSLHMRKARREAGMFLVEGAGMLMRARDHGWRPRTLLLGAEAYGEPFRGDLVAWAQRNKADVFEASTPVLSKIGSEDNPASIMGAVEHRTVRLPAAPTMPADATWLVLEQVRDPGNLGTIIRTAEAAGVAGIILVGNCCDPFSREAVRASSGSIFAVPIAHAEPAAFLAWRQKWPGDVIGTRAYEADDYRSITPRGPTMIVMGSESDGLSEPMAAACTRFVSVPMAPSVDSLNLAIATALVVYGVRH